MAKMTKMKQNWVAFALVLLASLVFIATWWNLWAKGIVSPAFAGAGGFWMPIFIGFGVIGSVALFFLSFGYISGQSDVNSLRMMNMWCLKATLISGVTLLVWAISLPIWAWASILGFVLGFLGTWIGWKDAM